MELSILKTFSTKRPSLLFIGFLERPHIRRKGNELVRIGSNYNLFIASLVIVDRYIGRGIELIEHHIYFPIF